MIAKISVFFISIILSIFLNFSFISSSLANNLNVESNSNDKLQNKTKIILFWRDGCSVCKHEKEFLESNENIKRDFEVEYLNINDSENKKKWTEIVEKYGISKITPITLIGGEVLVGFSDATEQKILSFTEKDDSNKFDLVDTYLTDKDIISLEASGSGCKLEETSSCSISAGNHKSSIFTLPFFGEIDVRETSLFLISFILGFIDGFNPCAMWVLVTFLVILSQIGDKRKMVYLTSVFLLAEAIMYFLILNVWYKTWNFISLDEWVTPMVGLIALGGGVYFLYKYNKNKGELVCDVTSLEHQQKTANKIKEIASKPIAIVTTFAVLGIAFSVNIIEFACSVGIAQSFTKIIEINELDFLSRQWYIFVYTLAYMIDDFIVFGLAIFGFKKFHSFGAKYSNLSLLIGGFLLLILGILLIVKPEVLVF